MSAVAIEIQKLSKRVPVGFWGKPKQLLFDVDLVVGAGRTIGFVGANGAGKSTTIKHIIGGARPTTGTVRVFGADPSSPLTRKRFGYMPELPYLPLTLTPTEMITLHAALYGVDARAITEKWLARVHLLEFARAKIGTFSKGMQTRLSLALALLHDPELLILDEPMSGLDPVGRQLVRTILREQAEAGRTILFSSHVLSDVEALCDDVAVIDKGRMVFSGTATSAVGEHTGAFSVRIAATANAPAVAGQKSVRKEGDTFLVVVDAPDIIDAATRLKSAGHTVISVEPMRQSLEDRLLGWISRSAS